MGKLVKTISIHIYPLVSIQKAMENGAVEIVVLPSYKMVIFHSYVSLPEGIHGSCELVNDGGYIEHH